MATLTPKLQRGDRVRAARTIRDGNRRHAIYRNTEGTVLFCGGGTATVQWDDSSIFVSVPLTALALTFPLPPATTQPGPLPARTVTELLRFESIQDLLTALGYEELHDGRALINPMTTHVIDYGKIAGRSVFEFVRWGLQEGWLEAHVKKGPAV